MKISKYRHITISTSHEKPYIENAYRYFFKHKKYIFSFSYRRYIILKKLARTHGFKHRIIPFILTP